MSTNIQLIFVQFTISMLVYVRYNNCFQTNVWTYTAIPIEIAAGCINIIGTVGTLN